MAHQSLYRRYRPRRFDEVRGQDHVTSALLNAVRNGSEGHAYLFSGPRGTGKTSTARILAKALNCENLQGGEPCCDCTPCVDMEAGRSFDLFELDAASNNGVDAVRDLIERTAVGSPGRTKVYILDEVHMLSPGASNALLKTLEEPPEHVRFVLATTDPQKVLPTIRSRTQHFEFQLLSAAELEAQVRYVISDAELDVDDAAVAWVVQKGRGSSRDTLSALDQVVAAGGIVTRVEPVEQLYEALCARDTGAAVLAVADALAQGHDPRVLGAAFLDSLRDAFLVSLDVDVPHLMERDREQFSRWAAALGTASLTRAMEAVGSALVDMRNAADPRVPLEVALVRLTSAQDDSVAGLLERVEALEAAIAGGAAAAPAARPVAAASAARPAATAPAAVTAPAARPDPAPAASAAAVTPADTSAPTPAAAAGSRSTDGGSAPLPQGATSGGGPAQARAELARRRANREDAGTASAASAERSPRPARPAPPPVPGAPPPVPGGSPKVPGGPPPSSAQSPPESDPASAGTSSNPSAQTSSAATPLSPESSRSATPGADATAASDHAAAAMSSTDDSAESRSADDSAESRLANHSAESGPADVSAESSAPDDSAESETTTGHAIDDGPERAPGSASPADDGSPAAADGSIVADPSGTVGPDQLATALDAIRPTLRPPVKAVCQDGSFVLVDATTAVYELGMGVRLEFAERFRSEIEALLRDQLGGPITLQMVASGDAPGSATAAPRIAGGAVDLASAGAATEAEADEAEAEAEEAATIDISELEDANDVAETSVERLTKAFPGAVLVDEGEVTT